MKNKNVEEKENVVEVPKGVLSKNAKGIKDLIAPAGIDFSNINHVEIVSTKTRYARSMIVANIPRIFKKYVYIWRCKYICIYFTSK